MPRGAVLSCAGVLFSHRRHSSSAVDALAELDRVLGPTWLIRRAHLRGVLQDERLTYGVLGRAAGGTRARATFVVEGTMTLYVGAETFSLGEGDLLVAPPGEEVLARCTDSTSLEVDWDPMGPLRGGGVALGKRRLGNVEREAARRLTTLVHQAAPGSREALTGATLSVLASLGGILVDAAARDLEVLASPDEQELCSAIDGVLSSLDEGPQVVSLEEKLGCSRRTVLRRTQALCKRYLLPGLAADDWRSVRDSYRLLIGVIFATHPQMTTRSLALMLGYASPEALCHAFANAGLPSPSALRDQADLRGSSPARAGVKT